MFIKKCLCGALAILVVGAVSASPVFALAQLYTDSSKTVLLRTVTTEPKNQPDALEWINNGPVTIFYAGGSDTCLEVEFGTTLLQNEKEVKLAMPFGVTEGDECMEGTTLVPTYFDTNGSGAVPANITLTGPPPHATIHKLKLSLQTVSGFCTATLENLEGLMTNVAGGFVEESPPNLSVTFGEPNNIMILCPAVSKKAIPATFTATFFLETPSTTTDTAFVG
jgi:hypothetical protein